MSGRGLHLLISLLLLVALGFYIDYATGRFRVGLILAKVEAVSLQAASTGRLSRSLSDGNLRLLAKAADLAPAEVLVPIQRAGQYVLMGRHDAAMRAYEEALQIEARAEIYRNYGQVQWQQGDREEAKESYHKAIWLDRTLVRQLGKYLPRRQRMEGGSLIVYEGFEAGHFGVNGLGRRVQIMKEGFESGSGTGNFPRVETGAGKQWPQRKNKGENGSAKGPRKSGKGGNG